MNTPTVPFPSPDPRQATLAEIARALADGQGSRSVTFADGLVFYSGDPFASSTPDGWARDDRPLPAGMVAEWIHDPRTGETTPVWG